VIGEAIGRMALRWHNWRRESALREAEFDGLCPECGEQMDFLKGKTEYREGGSFCPGFLFVCHGCMVTLWMPDLKRYKSAMYRHL